LLHHKLIHAAARAGDVEELKRLIAAGAPVNARGFGEDTPLMCASQSERAGPEILRLLLAAGADPNARNEYGSTALTYAVRADSLEKVELLVDAGYDVRATDESGDEALSNWRGNRALFDYLVGHGADCGRHRPRGSGLVRNLYHEGRFADLKYAHERGASLEPLELPPLTGALLFGTREEFEAVLARRPNLEATDFRGATALLIALSAGNLWAAKRLREAGANFGAAQLRWAKCTMASNALRAAIDSGDPAVVAWVLGHGGSVEAADASCEAPLLFAVEADRVEAARVLLDAGASIHQETEFGEQPINKASSLPMLELLIERGADVNHIDNCGEWPLKRLASMGNAPAVRWLLAAGAEVDLTSTGETALHDAVFSDDVETVDALLDAGAYINALDVDGQSVLFRLRSLRILRRLVATGIDFKKTLRDQCDFPAWRLMDDPELADEVKRLAIAAGAWREEEETK
jgi:ankyrin repeat protein